MCSNFNNITAIFCSITSDKFQQHHQLTDSMSISSFDVSTLLSVYPVSKLTDCGTWLRNVKTLALKSFNTYGWCFLFLCVKCVVNICLERTMKYTADCFAIFQMSPNMKKKILHSTKFNAFTQLAFESYRIGSCLCRLRWMASIDMGFECNPCLECTWAV